MQHILRYAVTMLALVSLFVPAAPALAAGLPAPSANCHFVLGFKALHDAISNVVGNCTSEEQHNADNGDGLQPTTGANSAGGLLVWRKADNWTAYTDGFHTWINGPNGLQERLNSQRFPWEADYDMLFTLTLSDLPSGLVAVPDVTGPITNAALVAASSNPTQEQAWIQESGRTGGYLASYSWNGAAAVPSTIVVVSYAQTFQSEASAQSAMTEVQATTPQLNTATGTLQSISAPKVGDQSIAFTSTATLTVQGQSVPVTYYTIVFRVGSNVGFVVTGGLSANADLNQAVALTQAQARHMQAHG